MATDNQQAERVRAGLTRLLQEAAGRRSFAADGISAYADDPTVASVAMILQAVSSLVEAIALKRAGAITTSAASPGPRG